MLGCSRALNREPKKRGIGVMALCPFRTKTEFFDRAVSENKIVKKYTASFLLKGHKGHIMAVWKKRWSAEE